MKEKIKKNLKGDLVLNIPTIHKEYLSGNGIITRGMDNCLLLYNEKNWKEVAHNLQNRSTEQMTRHEIRFIDIILKGAVQLKIGDNGKIVIPSYFKDYASIKKDVVFIDLGSHLEVWGKEEFKKYREKNLKTQKLH